MPYIDGNDVVDQMREAEINALYPDYTKVEETESETEGGRHS